MAYNDVQTEVSRREHLAYEEQKRAMDAANQNSAVARVVRVVYFLFAILEVAIGLRVVLAMLAANPNNGFAAVVYGFTQPFVGLFSGLFANPAFGNGVLELTSIVAMVVYAILAWIVGRVMWLALSRPR